MPALTGTTLAPHRREVAQQFDGRRRVIIEGASPEVDSGLFPAKRVLGDVVAAEADIFTDGHDQISAIVLHRPESQKQWTDVRMRALGNDRWRAEFPIEALGFHYFTFEAWIDHFLTWHRDLKKRVDADQPDLDIQVRIGLEMIRSAAGRAGPRDRRKLEAFVRMLEGDDPLEEKIEDIWSEDLLALMWRNADRSFLTRYERELAIEIEPKKAAFSTWYEMFPRSASVASAGGQAKQQKHGTFKDVEKHLPRIARMGFDVLYLPPIHPIGKTFRKGKNNRVKAEKGDVGSPWAIGGAEGGHTAIHADLGSFADFERLVKRARVLDIDVALDIAFQASPDHPYVKEHEEWFLKRPDGTIQYAENPPKKYQDIYPFHFETPEWQELWNELRDVFRFWIDKGVRVFRVDNPHTKPLPFWQWCLRELKRENPDTIFLAEAFTRPKIMYWLAKGGFSQSYTYFAWRNTKYELTEYFREISKPPVSDYFRPNAWPNTPDILTEYLQYGGRAGFTIRLMLAATLSANYGIYGPPFERFQGAPREAGSEEYLDSEKYEIRDWPRTDDDLSELVTVVNRIRRENLALQNNTSLVFHNTTDENIICYSKASTDGSNIILTAVNVDPHNAHSAWLELDLAALNLDEGKPFQVHELLSNARFTWHGARNYVQLNPSVIPAHIFRIRRRVRTERDFEYFL